MKKILKWFFIGLAICIYLIAMLVVASVLLPKSDASIEDKSKVSQVKEKPKKPKHKYLDFYKWVTTVDTKDMSFTRSASIESVCGIYKDVDGDGDKDFYTKKTCMQEKYKEYIAPEAFDTGTIQDMSKDLCAEEDLNRYSYICSRFGDMLIRIKSAKGGVDKNKNYFDAEAIYNDIASK